MVSRDLDAREAPPTAFKDVFKHYQKIRLENISSDADILDFQRKETLQSVKIVDSVSSSDLTKWFQSFIGDECTSPVMEDIPIFEHTSLPGLLILPSLLPSFVQRELLSRLLHRDLSDPRHMTNLHLHYDIPYPENLQQNPAVAEHMNASFFSYSPSSKVLFQPKFPDVHRPLSILRVLEKSLRWITLGGQYDWTEKVYPDEIPPPFPSDIKDLLGGLFPQMEAQAAIVNFYSPGDTLSLHRDVSEESDKGLISVSLGCDCLFLVGDGEISQKPITLRLRSGDAVFMSEKARFAWHGVPKIIPNTCPSYLESWPAESEDYEEWRDWMKRKRINLNVRQMRD